MKKEIRNSELWQKIDRMIMYGVIHLLQKELEMNYTEDECADVYAYLAEHFEDKAKITRKIAKDFEKMEKKEARDEKRAEAKKEKEERREDKKHMKNMRKTEALEDEINKLKA